MSGRKPASLSSSLLDRKSGGAQPVGRPSAPEPPAAPIAAPPLDPDPARARTPASTPLTTGWGESAEAEDYAPAPAPGPDRWDLAERQATPGEVEPAKGLGRVVPMVGIVALAAVLVFVHWPADHRQPGAAVDRGGRAVQGEAADRSAPAAVAAAPRGAGRTPPESTSPRTAPAPPPAETAVPPEVSPPAQTPVLAARSGDAERPVDTAPDPTATSVEPAAALPGSDAADPASPRQTGGTSFEPAVVEAPAIRTAGRREPPPPTPSGLPAKPPVPPQPDGGASDEAATAAPSQKRAALPPPGRRKPPVPAARGAYAVQLSSVATKSAAQREVTRLQRRLDRLLGGRDLRIRKTVLKARGTVYRIRLVGFAAPAPAKRMCTKIRATKVDCLVVRR